MGYFISNSYLYTQALVVTLYLSKREYQRNE